MTAVILCLQSDPRDYLCHYGLGVSLSGTGNIDGAIESLQAAISLKPNDVLTLSALAAALHASGTPERLHRAKQMYLYVAVASLCAAVSTDR